MRLEDRNLTRQEAAQVVAWRYPPPYDVHDVADATVFLRPDYHPVLDDDRLIGFACFGAEARVAGREEQEGVLDVGVGLDPALLGSGVGTALWPQLRRLAVERSAPTPLRIAVAAFNERSTRLCLSAGFVVVRELTGPGGLPFRELVRTPA